MIHLSIFMLTFVVFITAFHFLSSQSLSVFSEQLRAPRQLYLISFSVNEPPQTQPLEGRTIFLDPGHGGHDPGCVYPQNHPEYFEKDYNLIIAQEAAHYLESLGATVILTREDDVWLSIYARAAIFHLYYLDYINAHGMNDLPYKVEFSLRRGMEDTIRVNSENISDGCMGPMVGSGFSEEMIMLLELQYETEDFLFLSIHNNWNSQPAIRGTQVYYVTDESIIQSENRLLSEDPYYYANPDYIVREPYYGRDGNTNATLAQIMYDAITASAPEMETNTRQIVADNFAVLREHGIPSVMLELGFLSNETDREYLSDSEMIDKMAKGIAMGCVHYFEFIDSEPIVE